LKRKTNRPVLREHMSLSDFRNYYWMKDDLVAFARCLGVRADGYKPELVARIDSRLRGLPDAEEPNGTIEAKASPAGCDSNKPLMRRTSVVNYKSDERTRAFFEKEIGSHFHFTYHLNQYRLRNRGLTYGDLIDEWIADYEQRKKPGYKAPIASHGEYNRYIRDFFADSANNGSTLSDAVVSWKKAKRQRGDRSYASHAKRGRPKK
jgi:hypothetical protein